MYERVFIYALACGLPALLLAWAWWRWSKLAATGEPRSRRLLTMVTLVISSISWLILVPGPYILGRFAARPGDPLDIVYIRAIQLGLVSALTAVLLGLFTVRRIRVMLTVFNVLMLFMWLVAAVAL